MTRPFRQARVLATCPRSGAFVFCLVGALFVTACGSGDGPNSTPSPGSAELTADQIENGIGPVTHVDLDPLDQALVDEGASLFKTKCSACHKLDQRYIGPELGGVLQRRTPAFVMNMMLNPEEMTQRHPVARALLAEFAAPMANQSLTVDQARAILEYLRTGAPGA